MKLLYILSITLLCLCVACGQNQRKEGTPTQKWMDQNGKIKVLSTIAMIDDLVKTVGGEHVDAITLIKGELNPHSYQLVKGDDEKLAFADLIFYNGLSLEHGPSLNNYLNHSPKAIGLGNQILKHNPEIIVYLGDQPDPHIWMDASLWSSTLEYIAAALGQTDPSHKEYYLQNAEKLKAELMKSHANIKQEMHTIPQNQRYLVTSHDAFNYFTRAYLAEESELQDGSWSQRFAAPEGLAPESQLSPTHLQQILDFLMQHHIYVLFPESNVSRDSINKIVDAGKRKGLNLKISTDYLYADAMGEPGSDGDTYQKMIEHNAAVITRYLKHNHS